MKEGNTEVLLIRPMSLIHSQKESDQFPVNLFILSTWHSNEHDPRPYISQKEEGIKKENKVSS